MPENKFLYTYKNELYPEYLKHGHAHTYIWPCAIQFCVGNGLDIGGMPDDCLPGAIPINIKMENGYSAYLLPERKYDFIFSSHTLEHLDDCDSALKCWRDHIRKDGVLFLYLPHPDMEYWLPTNNKKHLHVFSPGHLALKLKEIGFKQVICSERDLFWSFSVVGIR